MFDTKSNLVTFADYLRWLGDIPADRVRTHPEPGTATVDDWQRLVDQGGNCELAEGILVDRPMGARESLIATILSAVLRRASRDGRDGFLLGEQGFIRLADRTVRAPDVAFYRWDDLPEGGLAANRVPRIAPMIAIEILSRGNTAAEMDLKRREYFAAGTTLVWIIDPARRTAAIYTSPDDVQMLRDNDTLTAPQILPLLRLPLAELFDEADGKRRSSAESR